MLKEIIKTLYKKSAPKEMLDVGFARYVQYFIFQRILRINGNVPWMVHWSSIVSHPSMIKLGKSKRHAGFMPGCYIQALNGIEFGNNVIIGPGVKLISSNHSLSNFNLYTDDDPIIIGDNCWLGSNSIILSGVLLGNHTIVAAGSVVTKSFPQKNVLIGGAPAKIIKFIPEYK